MTYPTWRQISSTAIVSLETVNGKPAWIITRSSETHRWNILKDGKSWLRETFENSETAKARVEREPKHSSSSIECPHCHWGFAPSVIDQHIREKH